MINTISELFSAILGHPVGRRVGIFSKLCLHGVAYDLERLFKNCSDIFGQPER